MMFSGRKSSPRKTTDSKPGGIAYDASSLLTHDVGKERKFRTQVHRKTLNPVFNEVFLVRGADLRYRRTTSQGRCGFKRGRFASHLRRDGG